MKKRLFVFGSYVTDLCAHTERFPSPGETVKGSSFQMGPGGKGSNQAVAAKRAGADVIFVTRVGADALGQEALDFYRREGFSTEHIRVDPEYATGAALIAVKGSDAQNQIIVVGGACDHFPPDEMPGILHCAAQADLLLTQLETNLEPVEQLLEFSHHQGILTILNPAPYRPLDPRYLRCVDIITPNETEAKAMTGIDITDVDSARAAARALIELGVKRVVITLGSRGCYALAGGDERIIPPVRCGAVADTTGAGDAFSGGLAAALSRGMEFFDAVLYGTVTAGIAVTRPGTAPAMPQRREIDLVFEQIRRKPVGP